MIVHTDDFDAPEWLIVRHERNERFEVADGWILMGCGYTVRHLGDEIHHIYWSPPAGESLEKGLD